MEMASLVVRRTARGAMIAALWLSCALTGPLEAFGRRDAGTSAASFLKLGAGARAESMGGAASASGGDADALYWNPARLAKVGKRSYSFTHAMYLENITYNFASYSQRMGKALSLGFAAQYLNAGAIEETDAAGSSAGSFSPNDMALTFGLARQFRFTDDKNNNTVSLGGSVKYIQSKIVETSRSWAVDMGAVWQAKPRLRLSAGAQNLGQHMKYVNEGDRLPMNVRFGAAYRLGQSVTLAFDQNFPADNGPYSALGTEYMQIIGYDRWFALRGGYNTRASQSDLNGLSSLSLGGGIGWRQYSIDFSWSPFGALGNAYRFSFSVKF